MLSPLRNRFGIPGVISVIALVFAMLGGAYAATNSGDGKATASAKKAKKGPRGPRGPAGPAGPAGPQGPAGAKGDAGAAGSNGSNGAPGEDGTDGTNGTNGAPGAAGKSIVSLGSFTGPEEVPPNEGECDGAGGEEYEIEGGGTQTVCNGKQGIDGSPWAVGGTLPPGATETGVWSFSGTDADEFGIPASISFPVPLAQPEISEENVHFQSESDFETHCPEPASAAEPDAPPGHLCVFYNPFGGKPLNATFDAIAGPSLPGEPGAREPRASNAGAVVWFIFSGSPGEAAFGSGSWAVTGCGSAPGPNQCP